MSNLVNQTYHLCQILVNSSLSKERISIMNDDLHSEKNSFNLETHKANHVEYTLLSLLDISFVLNVTKAVVY